MLNDNGLDPHRSGCVLVPAAITLPTCVGTVTAILVQVVTAIYPAVENLPRVESSRQEKHYFAGI